MTVKTANEKLSLTGNEAAAFALKQANPDVAAVFPITPQTELMHSFSGYVANGQVDTEMVYVESEHSAMSAVVGASSAGSRAITATSANGLALMWEIVYIRPDQHPLRPLRHDGREGFELDADFLRELAGSLRQHNLRIPHGRGPRSSPALHD